MARFSYNICFMAVVIASSAAQAQYYQYPAPQAASWARYEPVREQPHGHYSYPSPTPVAASVPAAAYVPAQMAPPVMPQPVAMPHPAHHPVQHAAQHVPAPAPVQPAVAPMQAVAPYPAIPATAAPAMAPQQVAQYRPPVQPQPAPNVAYQKKEDPWHGSIEGGFLYSTGNTETRDFNAELEFGYKGTGWQYVNTFELVNRKENGQQTDEEYRADAQLRYNLDDVNYLFGEVDYVKDRFGGFDYRITEVVGYGRQWMDNDVLKWDSEIGAGVQHVRTTANKNTNSPLARLSNNIEWTINEYLGVENHLRADFSDLITLRAETALKSHLTEDLYVKLGMDVEYVSEVPATKNETDTDVYFNIAYEY